MFEVAGLGKAFDVAPEVPVREAELVADPRRARLSVAMEQREDAQAGRLVDEGIEGG